MLAASGLHVRFLKIMEKSNYNTIKCALARAGGGGG